MEPSIREALRNSRKSVEGIPDGLRTTSNSVERDTFNDSIHQTSVFTYVSKANNASRTSETAFTGSRNTAMQKIGKSLINTLRNDKGYSFGGARDRFYSPTQQFQSPPPTAYTIGDSIGYESGAFKTKKSMKPHFTKDHRPGIDLFFKMNETDKGSPGPGSYNHFTEFSNSRKNNMSIRKGKERRQSNE